MYSASYMPAVHYARITAAEGNGEKFAEKNKELRTNLYTLFLVRPEFVFPEIR